MNLKVSLILLLVLSFSSFTDEQEIAHLFQFIEVSECNYERNGAKYKGAEAVKHINRKYQYYFDDIKSTEDFIKYAATKSAMSGKHYKIYCPDSKAINSRDWLLRELKKYRQLNASLL